MLSFVCTYIWRQAAAASIRFVAPSASKNGAHGGPARLSSISNTVPGRGITTDIGNQNSSWKGYLQDDSNDQ